MKNKRTLSIILVMALFLSFFSIPAYAFNADSALEKLGIITGIGSGVTEEYLTEKATRAQAALVNLRLIGLEEEAFAYEGEETFIDAVEVTEFWQPLLEYLKAKPMLGWVGYPDGSFRPNEPITGKGFTKILLVTLGYEYGLDFDWETTMIFASSLGMSALTNKEDESLTMGDIADAVFEALRTKTEDDRNLTLISKLVVDGIITENMAILAGFEIEEPTLAIINAYPSAVDEITVLANMDIAKDIAITLKRGDIGIAHDMKITGDTVILTGLYKFLPGTYKITLGEETASFVIEGQTATDLIIEANTIYDSGTQDLKVKLIDQYGDSMSLLEANVSVFNQTTGYVFSPTINNTVKITTGENLAEAGEIVNVFVYEPTTGLTATKEILVMEAPYIARLEFGDLIFGKLNGKTPSKLFVETKGNILDIMAYDQYGNEYILEDTDIRTADVYTTKEVQVLSSNSAVIRAQDITVEKGDLVFDADAAGSAVITLIIPNQGIVVSSEPIIVYAQPVLKTVEIAGPAQAVYANEMANFSIIGYDQYGNPMDVDKETEDVTFTTTIDLEQEISIGSTNQVDFLAEKDGTTTVYYFCKGIFQGTFTVSVNPAAYPMQIVGINNVPGAILTDALVTVNYESFNIVDQYGRLVNLVSDFPEWNIWMWTKDGSDNIEVECYLGYTDFYLYPLSELGTDTLYAGLIDPDSGELGLSSFLWMPYVPETVDSSIYAFDMQHVSQEQIYKYSMSVVGDIMLSDSDEWDTYSQDELYNFKHIDTSMAGAEYHSDGPYPSSSSPAYRDYYPYDLPLLITAYLEDGTEVALDKEGSNGLSSIIDLITFSVEGVEFDEGTRADYPDSTTIYSGSENEGSCKVKAWIRGEMVAQTSFEVSAEKPEVVSITAGYSDMDKDAYMLYIEGFVEGLEDPIGISEYMKTYYRTLLSFMYYDSDSSVGLEEILYEFDPMETTFVFASLFEITDQYGVELFWIDLLMQDKIQVIESIEETATGMEYYITIMTTDGIISDTIRVIGVKESDK